MSTLVVCVDRTNDIGRAAGLETPIVGWEAVRSLVTDVGLADPEDSSVNSLLEALRVTRDLRDSDEEAIVAVISGVGDSIVSADRAVARQMDELIAQYDPSSAVVVIDSAQDERLVPVIESRVPVDAVDRVIVRQARDLESTYYLLKQFLADEELRQTTLVPIGVALLVFPILMTQTSPALAVGTIAAVIGVFLLYKGLGVDEYLAKIPPWLRRSLYSGQVSIVTYVVATGLALIGLFAGAIGVSSLSGEHGLLLLVMQFAFDSVPWLAMAALAASTGRLIDEAISDEFVPAPYLNIPFGVVAVGVVIRGFSAYFLERGGVLDSLVVPAFSLGVVSVDGFPMSAGQRLALFVVIGVLVSLIGVQVSTYFGNIGPDEIEFVD